MGLSVEYRSAFLEEAWSRSGDLVFRSGHVNVTLGPRVVDVVHSVDPRAVTIDFLSSEDVRGLRTRAIDEATVIAMYMNNRAAEALAQGQLDDAYAWAREAVRQSPSFLSAHNTLGVIYLRHGDVAASEQVFRRLLAHEPGNTRAMSNLALVLAREGREAEAAEVRRELARIEPNPPYHFFGLGRAAMDRQDYAAARDWFAKEVARADYNPEFHYWLGLAQYRLGNVDAARKQLSQAMEFSTTGRDRELYAAKLAWLRTQRQ
jgi:Flp pilus assembly protein TadD